MVSLVGNTKRTPRQPCKVDMYAISKTSYDYRKWENKRPGALKFQTDSEPHENEGKFRRPSGALIAPRGQFEQ